MILTNTENSNMDTLKIAGWKITSSNIPEIVVAPPSPYYYSPSFINRVNDEVHESLLNESLDIYNEIWMTLAEV